MRCNPLRWLWGLIPVALLSWITVLGEQQRIENDLKGRTQALLAERGMPWAETDFKAREGVVLGRAAEVTEQKQAAVEAIKVWGVRSIEDRTDILELIKNYQWSAMMRGNDVTLSGYVPTEATRKAIAGTVRAALPGRNVVDQTKLARGAPDEKQFMAGIGFGLKQLAQLKGGRVGLDGNLFAIEGEAENPATYRSVKTAVTGALPGGIRLGSDGVTPPVIKPYTWAAALKGQQVDITGHAPSEGARDQIVAAAKKALPKATVTDRMVIGAGEPRDWQKVVATALAQLGQLTEGRAETRDAQLTVNGLAGQQDALDAVRRSLKADVPGGYAVTEQVRLDPKVVAEEEARRAAAAAAAEAARRAAEEAARRAAAEAEAKRRADEAARQQSAAVNTDDQRARRGRRATTSGCRRGSSHRCRRRTAPGSRGSAACG